MPSALAARKTLLDRRALLAQVDLQARNVQGPWQGYIPQHHGALLPSTAFRDVMGLVPYAGELWPDWGWFRFEDTTPVAAPLPLGVLGFPGTAPGRNVARLDLFAQHPTIQYENMAVTPEGSVNHLDLYRFGAAAQWQVVPSTAAHMSANALIADSATFAPANFWVFCTSVNVTTPQSIGVPVDNVRIYRPAIPDHKEILSSIVNFKARSLCVHDERVLFFYTSEGGTEQPLRVRWTIPGWTTDATTNFSDPGSGALDLIEFQSYGVAIRSLDTRIVCYTEDGVMFLDRTFSPVAPFRKDFVTRSRGLLATHAVCEVAEGTHFGIFTDGWWLFDVNGRFTEVGVFRQGESIERKFSRDFYDRLKWDARDRIVVAKEPGPRGFITIAFPTGTRAVGADTNAPDEVWIYDPKSDSAWPDGANYFDPNQANLAQTPTALGTFVEVPVAAVTIGDLPGTIGSLPGTIGSYAGATSQRRLVHGTWDGFVYQHEPGTFGRVMRSSTMGPAWWLETHPFPYGDPHRAKTLHRVGVSYRRTSDPKVIAVAAKDGSSASYLTANSFTADGGDVDGSVVDYVTLQARAHSLALRMAGSHPTLLQGWQEQFSAEATPFSKTP